MVSSWVIIKSSFTSLSHTGNSCNFCCQPLNSPSAPVKPSRCRLGKAAHERYQHPRVAATSQVHIQGTQGACIPVYGGVLEPTHDLDQRKAGLTLIHDQLAIQGRLSHSSTQ